MVSYTGIRTLRKKGEKLALTVRPVRGGHVFGRGDIRATEVQPCSKYVCAQ
jgi:hypothetical protein